MNRWTGMGRLVRDPDMKFTKNGKCLTRFALAINYKVNGENRSEFVQCQSWESIAEAVGEHYGKGDKILVTGYLTTRQYRKNEEKRFFTYVVVEHVELAQKYNRLPKVPEVETLPEFTAGSVDEWPPITEEEIFDEIPF